MFQAGQAANIHNVFGVMLGRFHIDLGITGLFNLCQQDGNPCSAMIAPIIDLSGCFGVLYVDNVGENRYYTLSDLDYLMLLSIHTAAIVENF